MRDATEKLCENSWRMEKTVLITGAAKRLGRAIAEALHRDGYHIAIHYRHSKAEAIALAKKLNQIRKNSAIAIQGDLSRFSHYAKIIKTVEKKWHRLDVLINNASEYFATPIETASEMDWKRLMDSNAKAPYFLIQAALPLLKKAKGCVINLSDMNTFNHKENYSIYCVAKSGINVITHMLSQELKPDVRVNAIAPGTTIPPEKEEEATPDLAKIHAVTSAVRSLIESQANGKILCMT